MKKKTLYKIYNIYVILVITLTNSMIVYAADDPLKVVNNLSDFIFGIIRAVGLIMTGFGVLQFGLSLKGQDPSQRANSILTIAGGIIVTFSKEILNSITR